MINVITEFGSSFKGLATYLYHDVEADTSERVAWTHTHNLATDDPEKAWRIMAATAMSQADLKTQAGVPNTGRKSRDHVMHYVLSWHTEEYGQVSREEMIDAAMASMTYIGTAEGERVGKKNMAKRTQYANQHQAVIVCHDEGPGRAPHVHVMLNRVHPEHGVMLPDSKDYEKLSAWALDYRLSMGKEHYCPQRQINAAKRAQGVLTSHPRKPRNVYEQDQATAEADPASRKKALLEQQQRRAAELTAKYHKMKRQQIEVTRQLEDQHMQQEKTEREKTTLAIRSTASKIRRDYAPRFASLTERQHSEIQAFHDAKATAGGHARNTWAAFKTKAWMTEIRTNPLHAMTDAFKLAFSSGFQQQQLQAYHVREQRQLRGERGRAIRDAAREHRVREQARLDELRTDYRTQRNDLLLTQDMDKAKQKAEWKQLQQDRTAAMAEDGRALRRKVAPAGDGWAPTPGGQTVKRQDQAAAGGDTLKQKIEPQTPAGNTYPGDADALKHAREIAARAKEHERQRDEQPRDQGRER